MRLTQTEVLVMAERIVEELLEKELIVLDDKEAAVQVLNKVILDELAVENRLNDEVRELMEKHSSELGNSEIEFHSMFKILKSKLVRERDLIL